jgi:sulfur-oxidizing protein SoxX
MKTRTGLQAAAGVAAVLVAGCASKAPEPLTDARVAQMMLDSFSDRGIATVDRLQQDASNAACSKAQGGALPADLASAIRAEALKRVRMPADGKFIGDWRAGEKLAQNGRGMTWSDKSAEPQANGGNCYNCHQISKSEISYGTIGPSLYQYGKNRGVTDTESPNAMPVIETTWIRLWNAKSYNACSGMPRFGQAGLLDEQQLKDLMALILDPKSPVNQ